MLSRGDVRPKWVLGVGVCLVVPSLLACKLLDRLKGGDAPAPSESAIPPVTSITPEFEAPPAVTVSAAVADASVPPDAQTKDVLKDAGTKTDEKKGTGTTGPKVDDKKDAGTKVDPKKDAGTSVDPKVCLSKCNKSLQKCITKRDPNGLPNIEKCSAAFAKCEKACK